MMPSNDSPDKATSEVLDFPEHLRSLFQRMRSEESLHDVVFVVQNERFSANRCVVAAASPVLRSMLTNGMKETTQREIQLEEVNADGWRMVLEYVYTARLEFDSIDSALRCLECANRFQCEDLEQVVSNYIGNKLDLENWYRILVVVDRINLTSLRDLTLNLVFANFYKLCFSVEISMLPLELIQEILNSDALVVRSELDVFKAVLRWGVCSGVNDERPKLNAIISSRADELLAQCTILPENNATSALESGNTGFYPELFDYVNTNYMSNNDLRRVVQFCRQLSMEADANHDVDLVQPRQLGEEALDKLAEMNNPIPNLPTLPYSRAPHERNNEIFTFSYEFSCEQTLISQSSWATAMESPEFVDKKSKMKWKLYVYFRGYCQHSFDKYVSIALSRNPTKASNTSKQEDLEFAVELFADIENEDSTSNSTVVSHHYVNANRRNYSRKSYGIKNFMPISFIQGKRSIVIGAAIYKGFSR